MAVTLDDYRNRIRTYLLTDVNAVDHWDNTRIDQVINASRRRIQNEVLRSYPSIFDIDVEVTLTDSATEGKYIQLPAHTRLVRRVVQGKKTDPTTWVRVEVVPVARWTREGFFEVQPFGALPRQVFVQIGDKLKLQTNNANVGGGTTYVLVYTPKIPDLVNGTDQETMPEILVDAVTYDATRLSADMVGDPQLSRVFDERAKREMEILRKELGDQIEEKNFFVHDVEGYDIESEIWF